jgi:hypothetical protein
MTFHCMSCRTVDAHTNSGSLFCHDCADTLTDEGKDAAIDAYLARQQLLRDTEMFGRAA